MALNILIVAEMTMDAVLTGQSIIIIAKLTRNTLSAVVHG